MAARTAFYSPAHRILGRTPPGSAGLPSDAAPSLDFGGNGIQDPRLPWNSVNSANGAAAIGWYGQGRIKTVAQVPAAIATANIAALANVVNGTAMTLVSSTGSGAVILAAALTVLPSLTVMPIGTLVIDAAPTYTDFATLSNGCHTKFYNASTALGRGISITGVSGGAGGAFLVKGADVYGYPMSQTITVAAGANTVNSLKTFKFFYSVTPQFTDAHNYSVGTADLFGFPLFMLEFPDADVIWGTPQALQTLSGGTWTAGVTTTASLTTGDVRGTWAPATNASDGTKKLAFFQTMTVGRMTSAPPFANLVGVAQF